MAIAKGRVCQIVFALPPGFKHAFTHSFGSLTGMDQNRMNTVDKTLERRWMAVLCLLHSAMVARGQVGGWRGHYNFALSDLTAALQLLSIDGQLTDGVMLSTKVQGLLKSVIYGGIIDDATDNKVPLHAV